MTAQTDVACPNPTGKGGFGDNPHNRNSGGRYPRNESFTYWYSFFKGMTVTEYNKWAVDNPENTRTIAANLALIRLENAKESLKEFKEVADRSEGKPTQKISYGDNVITGIKVEIVNANPSI